MSDILQQMMMDAGTQAKPTSSILDQMQADATAKLEPVTPEQTAPSNTSIPFGQRLNNEISSIPHQIGLTARYGLEGIGNIADALDAPMRVPMGVQPGIGSRVSDMIGLPNPQGTGEKVIGEATKLGVSALAPIVGGAKLSELPGVASKIGSLLASNPSQQMASALSSGAAGQYTKETGGDPLAQGVASLGAGIAAPFAMSAGNKALSLGKALMPKPSDLSAQVDIKIDNAMQNNGMKLSDLPYNVASGIRNDVGAALKINPNLSSPAISRLADYRLVGATPTNATLTLDPAAISQQKNLAKLGINSKDLAAQTLGRVENSNNNTLISSLNNLGANPSADSYGTGDALIKTLKAQDESARQNVSSLYQQARASTGKDLNVPLAGLAQDYANTIRDFGDKVPSGVRNNFNDLGLVSGTQQKVFTIDDADKLLKVINNNQSTDPAVNTALSQLRNSVKNAVLQADPKGGPFAPAVSAASARFKLLESNPALNDVVENNAKADNFVQKYILGSGASVNDVSALQSSIANNPIAMQQVKGQITASLKKAALNNSADEVGNFSQSAYNKALSSIGDRKLSLFFNPEEINNLKAVGRVASYEQFQPRGAAVNNSNTSGNLMASLLDRVGGSPLLSKIPLGNSIAGPAQNISIGIKSKNALDTQKALAQQLMMYKKPDAKLLASPALLLGVGSNQ